MHFKLYHDSIVSPREENPDGIVIPKEIRRTLKIREGAPSQTTVTAWEVFCSAMLDFCERGRLENT